MKLIILVFADWYLPGHKGGGSITALSSLIELLGDQLQFHVLTRDRDLTDKHPYQNVQLDQWITVGKAQVFYSSDLSLRNLLRRIREIDPDIIYLNSFFSRLTVRTLLLRKLDLLPPAGIVLAPRGEFSPGALELKRFRKWLYRKVAFAAGLYRDLLWQASSILEEEHIRAMTVRNCAGNPDNIRLASDVPNPCLLSVPAFARRPKKLPGTVRFIFLSRIARMKNLHFALELFASAYGEIQFDIWGPIDDAAYWETCQEKIRRLPNSIHVRYKGSVPQEQVPHLFAEYHFQILPTVGENFGYAILEALAAGCPVLISDQTPWRNLPDAGAGWDLSLGRPDLWQNALQECFAMDDKIYQPMSQGARSFAERLLSSPFFHRDSVSLFRSALDSVARQ